jgi:hypothetical protein
MDQIFTAQWFKAAISKASSGAVRRLQDHIGYPGVYIAEESETSP